MCFVGSMVVAVMVVKDSLALVPVLLDLEIASAIKFVTDLEIVVLMFLKLTAFQVVSSNYVVKDSYTIVIEDMSFVMLKYKEQSAT